MLGNIFDWLMKRFNFIVRNNGIKYKQTKTFNRSDKTICKTKLLIACLTTKSMFRVFNLYVSFK